MTFAGSLHSKCLQQYQIELSMLLTHECLVQISLSNAELEGGIACSEIVRKMSQQSSFRCMQKKGVGQNI